jgi:peptidoglycan hydrolase CwlO-like protein
MRNLGAVLAIGITAVIILVIGSVNFYLTAEAESTNLPVDPPAVVEETISIQDTEAVQAAYEARETLLLSQIAELDAELVDRQEAYDAHFTDLNGLIVAADEQLTQFENQETQLQEQIEQLRTAQDERTGSYESQRKNAYYQYQTNIQQLQAQLDEGKMRLNEALARLGQ